MDAELEFAIQPSTTGKQLFDQVSALLCSVFRRDGTTVLASSLQSPHLGRFPVRVVPKALKMISTDLLGAQQ